MKKIDVVKESAEKPLLFVRLGSTDVDGWVPMSSDLEALQAHLNEIVGDQYKVIVFHSGIELYELVDNPYKIQLVDLKSYAEFRRDIERSKAGATS